MLIIPCNVTADDTGLLMIPDAEDKIVVDLGDFSPLNTFTHREQAGSLRPITPTE